MYIEENVGRNLMDRCHKRVSKVYEDIKTEMCGRFIHIAYFTKLLARKESLRRLPSVKLCTRAFSSPAGNFSFILFIF